MTRNLWFGCRTTRICATAALVALAGLPTLAAGDPTKQLGYVDGKSFVEAVGDDAVSVEVSLSGALLEILTKVDEDLHELAGGLRSIHAVVLSVEDGREREKLAAMIGDTRKRLHRDGWDTLATIREDGGMVQVMVLTDDDDIQGLVVMVDDEGEFVFVNIAGMLDLAKLALLGEGMDLPGLEILQELEELGDEGD
jgi:hypothetical protein